MKTDVQPQVLRQS